MIVKSIFVDHLVGNAAFIGRDFVSAVTLVNQNLSESVCALVVHLGS